MATTADDWTYAKFLTAITTAGNIPIDIIAQTLGNIDVNVADAETIPIDITAATVGNIGVDIKASTIGNIPMNINEQGVGDINIDLNTQSIGRVVIRDHDGGIESSDITGATIGISGETSLHTKSGKGTLRVAMFKATNAGSHSLTPRIYIDGTRFHPVEQFSAWSVAGFDKTTYPFILSVYTVDGLCVFTYVFDKGIIFDTSLSFRFFNPSGTDTPLGDVSYFYQIIPA